MSDATHSQLKQFLELLGREEDPKAVMQRMIENWGGLQRIGSGEIDQKVIVKLLAGDLNPYWRETYLPALSFYPENYMPSSVEIQAKVIRDSLGGSFLGDSFSPEAAVKLASRVKREERADGLYVVPKPSRLSELLGIGNPFGQFGWLTRRGPIRMLKDKLGFNLSPEIYLDSDNYYLKEEARIALETLEQTQPGDWLVFPAQTGALYPTFSVRNARWEIAEYPYGQWPLPAYVVGWMVLANPHRLGEEWGLGILCPGDAFRGRGRTRFEEVLGFFHTGRGLGIESYSDTNRSKHYSHASGFN